MSAHSKPLKSLADLLTNTAGRLGKARGKHKQGTYKPEDFLNDMMAHWTDSVTALLDVGSGGAASQPMCFITAAKGSTPSDILSLLDSVNPLPKTQDLIGVKADGSGTAIIAKNKITFAFVDADAADEITVTVDLGGAALGTYQGLVLDGTKLLGTILVQVT